MAGRHKLQVHSAAMHLALLWRARSPRLAAACLQGQQPRLSRGEGTHAVVLVPTRELCLQVCDVLTLLLRRYHWLARAHSEPETWIAAWRMLSTLLCCVRHASCCASQASHTSSSAASMRCLHRWEAFQHQKLR